MSNDKKTTSDDPLVISVVTFNHPIDIGGVGDDHWSLENASSNRLHGKVRVEECQRGLRFIFSAGTVYQEVEVYASAIASVCRVLRSALKEQTRAWLETAGRR